VLTYGFSEEADFHAYDVVQQRNTVRFNVRWPGGSGLPIELKMPGRHNVLNALATMAVAVDEGVDVEQIQQGLGEFAGVGRRFQLRGEFALDSGGEVMVIDDYGHHPRELAVTIDAIRAGWPERRLVMLFQPHRYSRTRDLYEDFVQVLSRPDLLLLLEVYAAGEPAIPGIDGRALCRSIRQRGPVEPLFVEDQATVPELLRQLLKGGDILLVQGAGNVGALANRIAASRLNWAEYR
jgi:UDP-N-acetylmuramate--alanine ligase